MNAWSLLCLITGKVIVQYSVRPSKVVVNRSPNDEELGLKLDDQALISAGPHMKHAH